MNAQHSKKFCDHHNNITESIHILDNESLLIQNLQAALRDMAGKVRVILLTFAGDSMGDLDKAAVLLVTDPVTKKINKEIVLEVINTRALLLDQTAVRVNDLSYVVQLSGFTNPDASQLDVAELVGHIFANVAATVNSLEIAQQRYSGTQNLFVLRLPKTPNEKHLQPAFSSINNWLIANDVGKIFAVDFYQSVIAYQKFH